jgi:pimeloyl-ACP methyl ester carboxylesterase
LAPLSLFLLGVVTSTATGTTNRRIKRRERAAEARFPPTGRILAVDGVHIHAHVEGKGPDLVLLHGASGNTRDFTFSMVNRLKDDFRVIAFDRPGLGWSEPLGPQGTDPSQQARILRQAARILGADRPIVLGQSYGGAVALAWALEAPNAVAGLVIVAGASNPWPGKLGLWYRVVGSRFGRATIVPLLTAFATRKRTAEAIKGIFAPEEMPEGYADHIGAGLTLRRRTMRENARQVNGLRPHLVAMAQRYGTITQPVEILHGTADTTVPLHIHSEPLSRQIPGAHLVRLDGAGHMPHHTREDEVIAAIYRAATRATLR